MSLRSVAENIISRITIDINEKGISASGTLLRSLRSEFEESPGRKVMRVLGAGHIFFVEDGIGRGPTRSGSGNGSLQDEIRKWIDDKGITPNGISKDSLAYLIARKIHREGTDIYLQKREGLNTREIVNEEVRKGIPLIGMNEKRRLSSQIFKSLK